MKKNLINFPFQIFDLGYYKIILPSLPPVSDLVNIHGNNELVFMEKKENEKINDGKHNNLEKNDSQPPRNVELNNTQEKKALGRKRKGENNHNYIHTKYSDDNTRRKIKRIIISILHDYIKEKIKEIYGDDVVEGLIQKRLMKLSQKQIYNDKVDFNLNFLNKTLKEIFSEKITGRITNFTADKNKKMVEELINDKDENKRMFFQSFFNITFLEYLQYFRGDNNYFEGLPRFSEIRDFLEKKEGKDYTNHIFKNFQSYEIIYIIKSLDRKKSKNE